MPETTLPEQLIRTRLFTNGVPDQFTITDGGGTVLFLRSRAGDDPAGCLWALDLDSGEERLLAEPAAPVTARHSRDLGITAYATDATGRLVAFAESGHLWAMDIADDQPPRLLPAREPVADPRPDPTGRRIAYVHAGTLRVIEADGTGDRELAVPDRPGSPDRPDSPDGPDGPDVTFGVADFAASPPPGWPGGFWWSPDGDRLLVKRVDSARVPIWHSADPTDPAKPPRAMRYPAAGTANAEVTLQIIALDGTRTAVDFDHRAFEYVPVAGWTNAGPYFAVRSRDQRTARLLAVDPSDGATTVLAEQHDEKWVQLIPGLPMRTDNGTLLAHLDHDDTRYLTIDGTAVTPPGSHLRALLSVHGDEIVFTLCTEPTETELWSYTPAEGARRLSTQPGIHAGVRRDGTHVHVTYTRETPRCEIAALRNGKSAQIASFAQTPVLTLHSTFLTLGPRKLSAALYLPSWHQPGSGRLPVLMDPYGGPGTRRVTAHQDAQSLVSQWFADQGFAVLVVDGSGTPGRGPAWEREVHGALFTRPLADQVDALHEAARLHPDLDLTRVAVRGWSFGGSLALAAVLRRPDVFHVAVAGAGVTDQRGYNAPWRERFLGHPGDHPERYDADSLLAAAPTLTRPLLLVHGLDDTNVFPAHTLRMARALLDAGRPHEMLLLPGVGHAALSAPTAAAMLDHQVRFLKHHLHVAP